jgi:hypothetical protein
VCCALSCSSLTPWIETHYSTMALLPFINRQRVGYSEIHDGDDEHTNHHHDTSSSRNLRVLAIFAAVLVLLVSLVATLLSPSNHSSSPEQQQQQQQQDQHDMLKESLIQKKKAKEEAATTTTNMLNDAMDRNEKCYGIDWQQACESITGAGARRGRRRRRRRRRRLTDEEATDFTELEEYLLSTDDPSVIYDENCLRVYRLDLFGNTTFPYHASHLLRAGGNETMTLFIQHGAMRNAGASVKWPHCYPHADMCADLSRFPFVACRLVLLLVSIINARAEL